MNPLSINVAGINIDLSILSKERQDLFWKDPFFRSHLPIVNRQTSKKSSKKVLRVGNWGNEIDFISFPFRVISKVMPRLLEEKKILLHASGLSYKESFIILIGPSGFGKSTITGELIAKGCKLIGDDKIVLSGKNRIICGNPIISFRRNNLAQNLSSLLNLKIKKSKITDKYYLEPQKSHTASNFIYKKIFIIEVRLNNSKFMCSKLMPNDVAFDLFSDVLATTRGRESFSVFPPIIPPMVGCSNDSLKNALKNINMITTTNKNNLYYMEGIRSKISQEIIKLIKK